MDDLERGMIADLLPSLPESARPSLIREVAPWLAGGGGRAQEEFDPDKMYNDVINKTRTAADGR